jgi:hypothetical protein
MRPIPYGDVCVIHPSPRDRIYMLNNSSTQPSSYRNSQRPCSEGSQSRFVIIPFSSTTSTCPGKFCCPINKHKNLAKTQSLCPRREVMRVFNMQPVTNWPLTSRSTNLTWYWLKLPGGRKFDLKKYPTCFVPNYNLERREYYSSIVL